MTFIELSEAEQILTKLKADTKPLWGTMNAQQVVEHLEINFHYSSGTKEATLITPKEHVAPTQKFLMGEKPLPKEYKAKFLTEKDFELRADNLNDAIGSLLSHLNEFLNNYEGTALQPAFGILDKEKWIMLNRKHFTHHFSQFGLV